MKELENIKPDSPADKKEEKLLGTYLPHKGHKFYEWLDGKVSEAVSRDEYVKIDGTKVKEYDRNPNGVYLFALNLKNAIKKFKQHGLEITE